MPPLGLSVALSFVACASSQQEPWRYGPLPNVHAPWLAKPATKPATVIAAPLSPSTATSSSAEPAPLPAEPTGGGAEPPVSLFTPSPTLRAKGLWSPAPGAVFAGYVGDTGLDLATPPRTVYALAAASVDYAEKGHTRWVGPKDTAYCIRLAFDTPIPWKGGHRITHAYYAHLSAVSFEQKEGAPKKRHVLAGEPIGISGTARGVPHLHLGLLLDNEVEQDDWTYILREGEVRAALGGYSNGETLPKG